MFRNFRTSRPLTALATLMALGTTGCNIVEIGPLDFSNIEIDLDLPDEKENGKLVKKLTDRQPEPFYLLAGGATYMLTWDAILAEMTINTGIIGNTHDENGDSFRFRRDDPEGGVGIKILLEDFDGTRIFADALLDAADLDSEQSGPFKSYTGTGSEFDIERTDIKLSVVEPGEAILGLEYATFGSWSTERVNKFEGGFFFSGVPTKESGMPKTGMANYDGLTIGTLLEAESKTRSSLEGDMALAVNFADGSVDGDFTSMMKTAEDGAVTPWRDFSMSASINAGTDNFSGTTATNDGLLSGQAEGAFFGPGAAEVAGAWTLSGDGEIALGSFGGGQE